MEKIANFGNRLNLLLNENGMNQTELSIRTGISRSLINKYINNVSYISEEKLQHLAQFFDVNPLWLQGYDVPKSRRSYVAEQLNETFNPAEKTITKTRALKDGSVEHSSIKEKDLLKMFYDMNIEEFDDVMKYIALRTRK